MSDKTKFKVVRGYEEAIQAIPYTDGQVYFALDSGRIYLDARGEEKIPVGGGNGVVIHYGNIPSDLEPESLNTYSVTLSMLEDQRTIPQVGDLILNSDGTFFRIIEESDDAYKCVKVLVSGGAGGGGSAGGGTSIGQAMSLIAKRETPSSTVLNGQSVPVTITATSAKDINGMDIDTEIYLTYTIYVSDNGALGTAYQTGALNDLPSGDSMTYDFGPELRESTSSIIVISATTGSMEKPKTTRVPITCSELRLTQAANFSNNNVFYSNEQVTLACNAIGNLNKILEFSFDGDIIETLYLAPGAPQEQKYQIPARSELLTHGVHTIKFEVFQDVNPNKHEKGLSADPIELEIAVVDKQNTKPVIWLGDFLSEYKTYDDIQIPFKVYDNGATETKVYFYKNNQLTSDRDIKIGAQFEVFEIADADQNTTNYYSIGCGEQDNAIRRDITFTVVEDKEHDMTNPQIDLLQLNFDAKGRSNNESSVARATWIDKIHGKQAKFTNFNWVNNGWIFDSRSSSTSLKISNGATFEIPFGPMTFNGGAATDTSNSFDFQFKVSNIQNYSSLIKTITRYVDDDPFYAEYQKPENQKKYASYDSFLGAYLPATDKKPNAKGVLVSYDDLEFLQIDKLISLDNVICGFYDGDATSMQGICIGPQDVFFSNGSNTVSADFVEDEMVYLTVVYDGSKQNADGELTPMMSIYVNGVLTGIVKTDLSDKFTIGENQPDKSIVFSSNVCDIDLYKVRFYNTALTVNDVVMNYAIDNKDITTYDQNGLAEYDNSIQEFRLKYQNVLEYNIKHNKKPLMPYVIFDTSKSNNNDRLSFSKKFNVTAGMEFHNTPLELAYASGELEELAIADGLMLKGEKDAAKKLAAIKTYYLHHCPSFVAENVNLAVQGTSSEFYPRRNYKIKTKTKYDDDGVERVHFWINGGPYAADFEEHGTARDVKEVKDKDTNAVITPGYTNPCHSDWFYFDNYTNGSTKFTMKVDYMESSGSYNMGLANLVKNCYSKHPLEDYMDILNNTDKLKSPVLKTMRWQDYRTSVQGYPVMAFHKKSNGDITFIGLYRMLSDKGSDEMYGFKPDKKVTHKAFKKEKTSTNESGETVTTTEYSKLRDVVECWEFSDNNRGFCSFRDPWNREVFSFKAPDSEEIKYTSNLAPLVADSFEYRYSKYDDALDVIYELADPKEGFKPLPVTKDAKGNYTDERTATLRDAFGDDLDVSQMEPIHNAFFKAMKNWEKACAWVWATNSENAMSGGTYNVIKLGDTAYAKGAFYVTEDGEHFFICNDDEFKPEEKTYYVLVTREEDGKQVISYEEKYLVDANHLYKTGKYYVKSTVDDSYVLSNTAFDSAATYYEFIPLTEEEMDAKIANPANAAEVKHTKRLTERYPADKFPGYLTEDGYAKWDEKKKYLFDTQEFRNEKFVNELAQHFDLEYLATYFVITEVLECYDSRGKNCMMASWGPQTEGGEYIWYPIFYDMDTQLGINNTGIPSFSYNVDATEEGNFSTSDSLLWNNFYKNYKNSAILKKYQHLKGQTDATIPWPKLSNPPFQSVNKIEKWYSADPTECGMIAMRGERPLIAKNLDEYFKYITITNDAGLSDEDNQSGILNTTGYQSSGAEGEYTFDKDGTYFYALQGDRSLSRRQFLANRMEYIDSWLNQGNYQRGGANRIRGRVSANYQNNQNKQWYTSDRWLETEEKPYWVNNVEFGTKTNDFDSQYWVTLQPVRNTYVTLGGDANSVYPSQKYSGIPINYKINEMETAARSKNLAEKLLYIYGMNQIADPGDLYKNYWTEFYLEGKADKLSRLLLGCDGLMTSPDGEIINDPEYGDTSVKRVNGKLVRADKEDPEAIQAIRWFNNKMNLPTFPSSGMPLLEKANFSNLTISVKDPTLNLTKSQKLQDFRATGSNFSQIDFAEGAALHTVYLPSSITRVVLQQTKLLKNIITSYSFPEKVGHDYIAEPGLYIQGLTDVDINAFNKDNVTKINVLKLIGDSMGYDSYKLLEKYYKSRSYSSNKSTIEMTEVQWTPYRRLVAGDEYQSALHSRYFRDNGHYGFEPLEDNYDVNANFANDITNGELYILDENFDEETYLIKDSGLAMLQAFMAENSNFNVTLTGDIYIANTTAIDEVLVRNTFNTIFPKLNVTFKTVTPSYSAKFIVPDLDDNNIYLGTYSYVPLRNGSAEKSIQKMATPNFENPYEKYNPEASKDNYDFLAWSTSMDVNDTESYIGRAVDKTASEEDQRLQAEANAAAWRAHIDTLNGQEEIAKDHEYYALFIKHKYEVRFYNGTEQIGATIPVTFGERLDRHMPSLAPIHPDEDKLDVYESYRFLGFSRSDRNMVVDSEKNANLVDYSMLFSVTDYKFYAVYMKVNVHDIQGDDAYYEKRFAFDPITYTDESDPSYNIQGYQLTPKAGVPLSGKVTLPTKYKGLPVVALARFSNRPDDHITHIFWDDKDGDNPGLREIGNNAFQGVPLRFFEFTSKLRKINNSAFLNVGNGSTGTGISDARCIRLLSAAPLLTVGDDAFNATFDFYPNTLDTFALRGTIKSIGQRGFQFYAHSTSNVIGTLMIGSPSEPSVLSQCGISGAAGIKPNSNSLTSYFTRLVIYAKSGVYNGLNVFIDSCGDRTVTTV